MLTSPMRHLAFVTILSLTASAKLMADNTTTPSLGQKPATATLAGDNGGLVKDGSSWSSDMLKDKVYLLLYVDPDASDLNNALTERLKKEAFPHDKFGSVAVINMAATWKPNAIISSVLKSKQEQYPNTVYVKDYKSQLVKAWGLADKSYETILFDREGRVLFRQEGQLKDDAIEKVVELIKKAMP